MSITTSQDTANEDVIFAISINGADSQELVRDHPASPQFYTAAIPYRTATPLAAGTYTVTGRWRVSAGTATLNAANLTCFALADRYTGDEVPNDFVTVATDSTTSTTLTDITGLTTSITTDNTAHIAAWLGGAGFGTSTNAVASTTIDIDSEGTTHTSNYYVANEPTGTSVTARTNTAPVAGTYTVKGQHAINTGTLTTQDIALLSLGMEAGSGLIPSNEVVVASDSTASASLVDIAGSSITVTLNKKSRIVASMTTTVTTSDIFLFSQAAFALRINGVDSPVYTRTIFRIFAASDRNQTIHHISDVLDPGTYTIVGRYAAIGGVTVTLNNTQMFAWGTEVN